MTPDDFTNQEFFLDVTDGHQIYVHDWGKADAAIPILFLHGGPGNGVSDSNKKMFDPAVHRAIFHDQRGAGKSLPAGSLAHNATDHLIEDIEKIAERLQLKKFVLVGGSWGSTLALAYGIAHSEKVAAMILDGIFTATAEETDWLDKGAWRTFFPDRWEEYQATVPKSHQDNPSAYHYEQLQSDDPEKAKQSAYDYLNMELGVLKLDDRYQPDPYDKFEPGGGLIEMHYLSNGCFLPEGYILDNAHKLTMPIRLIQGRYDMVCPPITAHRLHKALPNSQLIWTINGHTRQHEAANIQRLLLDLALGEA